jgi:hypothetical protein
VQRKEGEQILTLEWGGLRVGFLFLFLRAYGPAHKILFKKKFFPFRLPRPKLLTLFGHFGPSLVEAKGDQVLKKY